MPAGLRVQHIRFAGGGTEKSAAREVPEKEAAYPKGDMLGALPAYGFYCRHVSGLRLSDFDLSFDKAVLAAGAS